MRQRRASDPIHPGVQHEQDTDGGRRRGSARRGRQRRRRDQDRRGRTDDGSVRRLRSADEGRCRAGGQGHQRRRRRQRRDARTLDRRRRVRPEAGRRGRQQALGRRHRVHGRPLLLGLLDPGLRGLRRGRGHHDHSRLDQSDVHRRASGRRRVPRLRPGRPSGRHRGQVPRRQLRRRQEDRDHPRQDRLREGSRRRHAVGARGERRQGGDVRGLHRRREGLHGADHQAQAGEHRRALRRRLPHRGGPDGAPAP